MICGAVTELYRCRSDMNNLEKIYVQDRAKEFVMNPSKSFEKNVDHPSHYNQGKIEVIDVIEDWGLDFNEGNVVKYLARSRHKGKRHEDLKKALWYLTRLVANEQESNGKKA